MCSGFLKGDILYYIFAFLQEQRGFLKRREFKVNSCYCFCSFSVTSASFKLFNLLFTNYLGGFPTSGDFSLHSLHLYFMYLLLGRYSVSPSSSQSSLFSWKRTRRGKCFQAFCVWKASEGDLDLGRWRSAVIRSGFGLKKKERERKKKKKKQKTPTQVHMALPFPLPSCANLDMITSEKSRGGSGFAAEMEDTASVCFCACILLHVSESPSHTHIHTEHTVPQTWNSK